MTHLLLILLLLLLFPSSFSLFSSSSLLFSSSYDPLLAKEAWIYSIASYCNADRLKTWDIADLKVFYPDMKDISVFYSSTGDNQGFVGFNEKTNLVVMAFRGSSSIENWMENIDLIKTNYFRCNVKHIFIFFYVFIILNSKLNENSKCIDNDLPNFQNYFFFFFPDFYIFTKLLFL